MELEERTFILTDSDGYEIFVYHWSGGSANKGVVQISHGMVESAARYRRFAERLVNSGYVVYANDHRGHGQTAGAPEKVGYCGHNGFTGMVSDMHQLTDLIRVQNPGLPILIFGHSMGSFLTQQYMVEDSAKPLAGVILSGTSGKDSTVLLWILSTIARKEIKKHGAQWKSQRLTNLIFGNYNRSFKPSRTEFDWLSRDPVEVDEYINNPFYGAACSSGFYADLFEARRKMFRSETLRKLPESLPVYILAGARDPVGRKGSGVLKLVKLYQKYGLKHVESRIYSGGRHEMLNETNRDEVMKHVIEWMDLQIEKRP